MSATASALFVMLVGALLSTSVAVGPPSLPPESGPPVPPPTEAPATDPPAPPEPPADTREGGSEDEGQRSEVPPPPVRDSLPSGLQPVPFPLENQRRGPAPSDDGANPPAPQRRSIVDLRDPFDRPPPRTHSDRSRDTRVRLLMPDLKDPFAPGVRRIRSQTLDRRIPNDIIDPFGGGKQGSSRPLCVKKTEDGTVVQGPNKRPVPAEECRPSRLDLRDPFH